MLVTELSYDKDKRTRNSTLLGKIPAAQSQEGSSQTIQRVSSKRVRTTNGRMTRRVLIVRNPTRSLQELFDKEKKERNNDSSKRRIRLLVGLLDGWYCHLRNVHDKIADGKASVREKMVRNPTDLGSRSEPKSAASPCLRKTRHGCINLARRCSVGYP